MKASYRSTSGPKPPRSQTLSTASNKVSIRCRAGRSTSKHSSKLSDSVLSWSRPIKCWPSSSQSSRKPWPTKWSLITPVSSSCRCWVVLRISWRVTLIRLTTRWGPISACSRNTPKWHRVTRTGVLLRHSTTLWSINWVIALRTSTRSSSKKS